MNDKFLKLKGIIEDIIYQNESNGYSVIDISNDDTLITCTGIMPGISVGESIILYGYYIDHPTYGPQFSVNNFEKTIPTTIAGILSFLSNGAIKGIGPSSAAKLIKKFGENTLEILENEPERIAKIKGFSLEKAKDFSFQLKQNRGFSEVIEFLRPFNIQTEIITYVFKKYGNQSIAVIKDNPFILCEEGLEVKFETADNIADSLSLPKDISHRIRAAILYILKSIQNEGHTCIEKIKLINTTTKTTHLTDDVSKYHIEKMINENSIFSENINDFEYIFSKKMYDAETHIASSINSLLNYKGMRIFDVNNEIQMIEKSQNIKYAELQIEAIKKALNEGLLILTGGPGTGKTTTLNAIIHILKQNGQNVIMAAPTGRAAQRITELTGEPAKTIHRLLEATVATTDNSVFKKNENNQLECDALILDESSMIDANLFSSLIKALPLGCRLIIVGDSDQLPSVGAGNVLGDLIESGLIPCVKLNDIFRQSQNSLIVINAHRIVNGEMPDLNIRNNDFFFLGVKNNKEIKDLIISLYTKRLPDNMGFNSINDIQIISPTKKTPLGTIEINKSIQNAINPSTKDKKEIKILGNVLREYDKVMQIKNDYDIPWINIETGEYGEGIFNGDIGILQEIDKSSNKLKVLFDNKLAIYEGDQVENLELAYACTVHKSQGNEFDVVILPVFNISPQLMYRNLLYTGVTRAKKLMIIVGYQQSLKTMIENNRKITRNTGLKAFLQK